MNKHVQLTPIVIAVSCDNLRKAPHCIFYVLCYSYICNNEEMFTSRIQHRPRQRVVDVLSLSVVCFGCETLLFHS